MSLTFGCCPAYGEDRCSFASNEVSFKLSLVFSSVWYHAPVLRSARQRSEASCVADFSVLQWQLTPTNESNLRC